MRVLVFDQQGCHTQIHNALLDVVMPLLGGNAWKVLSAIIRHTVGRQRDAAALSQRTLQTLTGIRSHHTLEKAIKELREFKQADSLISLIVEVKPAERWEAMQYSLNRDIEHGLLRPTINPEGEGQ